MICDAVSGGWGTSIKHLPYIYIYFIYLFIFGPSLSVVNQGG